MPAPTDAGPAVGAETRRERIARLRAVLAEVASRDRRRLAAALERAASARRAAPADLDRLEGQLTGSAARVAARRASLPAVTFDGSLPVHQRHDEIVAALTRSRVVVVSGSTGCGKSTQLPKLCLELGRGCRGLVGHTQPRRIAAQALAGRIAAELGTAVGDLVGYQVRFVDRTSPRTLVKLMTDGVLLREIDGDPLLERYDTLIIDEAHERSLNVDFLLGVLKGVLERREDLRLIVTSATIETARFAEYFGGAPVIDVEGRSYPVELRYRPVEEEADEAPSLPEAVEAGLDELARDAPDPAGDALVFLPGEKQIREVREHLQRRRAADWDVLPLYARLSAPEQERIFAPHAGRRVILATNVAETSLTIPGVRFVIDSGLARVSRYSPRAKFQRLPIEPVSQASADQRKGRCGREGPGICIRLYAEDDYAARPQYTDPEIRRTNLASLILQMSALGLGAPEEFPFLDPPDTRLLNDGYRLLQELAALDGDRRITRIGRHMAALPLDPRLARVLVEAGRLGCLAEALLICAFLSIQDPRERPAENAAAADEKHAGFADERSDFVGVLNLWTAFRAQAAAGGSRALRRWCQQHFLSFRRMREWQDLHEQLGELAGQLRLEQAAAAPPSAATLHQAILSGFLSGIGVLDADRVYLGARDTRFVIAPGTPVRSRSPRWVVAASLVETQRVYARMVAAVQPSWIEAAGAHLLRRTYSDAEWRPDRGQVLARETVSLYGRVLSAGRQVDFATIDPAMARRIFVEEALVRGRSGLREAFLERNAQRREAVELIERKLRTRDVLVDDGTLVDFYLERLPPTVASTRSFERWWAGEQRRRPGLLDMPAEFLMRRPVSAEELARYPDSLEVEGNRLALEYRFDPSQERDGVTLKLPLPLLAAMPAARADWLVPGLLRDKVTAVLRGLPKSQRRALVPIPAAAGRFLDSLHDAGEGSFYDRLAAFVTRETGEPATAAGLRHIALPPHLQLGFEVVDLEGTGLRSGHDLGALQAALKSHPAARHAATGHDWEREGVRRWDFGELPDELEVASRGLRLRMFPGLEDAGGAVRLRLFANRAAARRRSRGGVLRLAALAVPQQWELVRREASADRELGLLAASAGLDRSLFDAMADRAVDLALAAAGRREPRGAAEFEAAVEAARSRVAAHGDEVRRVVKATLAALREARAAMSTLGAPVYAPALEEVRRDLVALLEPGWVRSVPEPWFWQSPKYVRAAVRRLERLRGDVPRDRRLQSQLQPYAAALARLSTGLDPAEERAELERLRWMLEEFRLSLFAQELKTLQPVSAPRLDEQFRLALRESGRG